MPGAAEILDGLTRMANEALGVAIVWHVIVAWCIVASRLGFRVSRRVGATLLSFPLASVALLAWVFDNPFNAAVFALTSVGLAVLAAGTEAGPEQEAGGSWSVRLGWSLVAFAWVYPHFLIGHPPVAHLYAAPLGVLPCPTLSLVVGVSLVGRGLVGGAWRMALALVAAFYGLFGALVLGVRLDAALLAGAIMLGAQHWQRIRPRQSAVI